MVISANDFARASRSNGQARGTTSHPWPERHGAFDPRRDPAAGKPADAFSDTARVAELRPTQATVGFREVARKRRDAAGLRGASIPVVRGPWARLFILDRHHLVRALYDEGVERVNVSICTDLSMLSMGEFWEVCLERGWCHPYDAAGRFHDPSAMPRAVGDLADDPYRSLASAVRHAGGFAKTMAIYSEFSWADFLRRQLPRATLDADFDQAVRRALALAHSPRTAHLPGWRLIR